MRKGTISRIFWIFILNAYNLESKAATDFNFGVKILTSSCYTRKKFHAMPTSGLGRVSMRVDRVQKSPFYASLWQFTVQYRRLTLTSNIESVK